MDFLPLHNNANIHEGNSLNMDWEEIIKPNTLSYIMGNQSTICWYKDDE